METLTRWATGKNILILLALFLIVNLVLVPAFYPKFQTLDTLPSYTPHDAYQLIASYGDQGRQLYLLNELTLDLAYPIILALLFSLAILYTFRRGFPNQPWTRWLAIIPFAVMAADYLENACVVTMLVNYPRLLPTLAKVSNVFTVIKGVLSYVDLIFIVGLAAWLMNALRRRAMVRAESQ